MFSAFIFCYFQCQVEVSIEDKCALGPLSNTGVANTSVLQ